MDTVTAEFEQGSKHDPLFLFAVIILIIIGFLTLYEFDFWNPRNDLWMPLSGLGCALIFLNVTLRLLRPKLKIDLLSDNGDMILVQLPSNIQFSAWINEHGLEVKKTDIRKINIFDFRRVSTVGPAGMFMVRFDLHNGKIIEGSINDIGIVKNIIEFIRRKLPNVTLHMDDNIKSNKLLNPDASH